MFKTGSATRHRVFIRPLEYCVPGSRARVREYFMTRVAVVAMACSLAFGQASAQGVTSADGVVPATAAAVATGSQVPAAASEGRTTDPFSSATLFRDLGRDLKRLPSVETAAILGVGGAL